METKAAAAGWPLTRLQLWAVQRAVVQRLSSGSLALMLQREREPAAQSLLLLPAASKPTSLEICHVALARQAAQRL